MNVQLFTQSIQSAQIALLRKDRVQFVACIRVAQAMTGEELSVVRLLERCITDYPAARVGRTLRGVSRRMNRRAIAHRL